MDSFQYGVKQGARIILKCLAKHYSIGSVISGFLDTGMKITTRGVENGNKMRERLLAFGIEPESTPILDTFEDLRHFRSVADASFTPTEYGWEFSPIILRKCVEMRGYQISTQQNKYPFRKEVIEKDAERYMFTISKQTDYGEFEVSRRFIPAIDKNGDPFWISTTVNMPLDKLIK